MQSSLELAQRMKSRSGEEWWRAAAWELWALWQSRPRLSKRAVLAIVWTYTPLRLKLAAVGAAALAVILTAGALAVVVLALEALFR